MSKSIRIVIIISSILFFVHGFADDTFEDMNGIFVPDFQIKKYGYDPFAISLVLIIANDVFIEYEIVDKGSGIKKRKVTINKMMEKLKKNLWIFLVSEEKAIKIKYIKIVNENTLIYGDLLRKGGKNLSKNSFLWKKIPDSKLKNFKTFLSIN